VYTIITDQQPPDGTPLPCRDYDPDFKLHGCELEAGHEGPHRDRLGSEWDEHLPDEPGRCASHAPWGSGWPGQRCTLATGHDGQHRDRSGNEWAEVVPVPPGAAMELNARIVAAAAVLGDYKAEVASAPLSRPPGLEWMLRLADVLGGLLGALNDRDEGDGGELDGLEPYCAECGAWIGMFFGMEGWRHFRGDPTPGGQRELYDAGHEAVPAWTEPPGRSVSPADAAVLRQALADAERHRRGRAAAWCMYCEAHPAGACETHVDDLDQAGAYAALSRQLEA